MSDVRVLKFGGSSLTTPEMIKMAALKTKLFHDQGHKVIVIVSAMGDTTNQLIQLSNKVSSSPNRREMDMLISAGERISMALMSMALHELGCDAISFTGSQAGILTSAQHNEADIIELKPFRVSDSLKQNKIVIIAGFQGVDPTTKEITTLGRGGSDITAVAFADYFKAQECTFLKDVEGLQTADPKKVNNTHIVNSINFDKLHTLCQWGSKILHPRSIEYAKIKNVKLSIMHFEKPNSPNTSISSQVNCSSKAISSISPVFKFQINNDLNSWLKHFTGKHNLPFPRMTHQSKDEIYLAAPKDLISTYRTYLSKEFTLQEFSAVTIVGCDIPLQNIKKADHAFNSKHGLHLFLNIEHELEVLNSLHKELFSN